MMDNSYPVPLPDGPACQIFRSKTMRRSGMLRKKAGGMKIPLFQDRYDDRFIIINNGWVYYYKNEKSDKPQGKFSLQGYSSNVVNAEEEEGKMRHVFKVYGKNQSNRIWYFATDNELEKNEWMEAFRCEIEKFNFSKSNTMQGSLSYPLRNPNERRVIDPTRPNSCQEDGRGGNFPSMGNFCSGAESHKTMDSGIGDEYEPVDIRDATDSFESCSSEEGGDEYLPPLPPSGVRPAVPTTPCRAPPSLSQNSMASEPMSPRDVPSSVPNFMHSDLLSPRGVPALPCSVPNSGPCHPMSPRDIPPPPQLPPYPSTATSRPSNATPFSDTRPAGPPIPRRDPVHKADVDHRPQSEIFSGRPTARRERRLSQDRFVSSPPVPKPCDLDLHELPHKSIPPLTPTSMRYPPRVPIAFGRLPKHESSPHLYPPLPPCDTGPRPDPPRSPKPSGPVKSWSNSEGFGSDQSLHSPKRPVHSTDDLPRRRPPSPPTEAGMSAAHQRGPAPHNIFNSLQQMTGFGQPPVFKPAIPPPFVNSMPRQPQWPDSETRYDTSDCNLEEQTEYCNVDEASSPGSKHGFTRQGFDGVVSPFRNLNISKTELPPRSPNVRSSAPFPLSSSHKFSALPPCTSGPQPFDKQKMPAIVVSRVHPPLPGHSNSDAHSYGGRWDDRNAVPVQGSKTTVTKSPPPKPALTAKPVPPRKPNYITKIGETRPAAPANSSSGSNNEDVFANKLAFFEKN